MARLHFHLFPSSKEALIKSQVSSVHPRVLRGFRFLPRLNQSLPGLFILAVLVSLPLLSVTLAASTAPPIGENAYCGKGNVPQFGDKDGPAELPKTCYYTGLDGTPSPGKRISVDAKADLASAVESAKCGDTLLLPAGAVYEVREFPAKKCDDNHYITIRTDIPDSKLPPEGTRISPAWAGIASLPGRPPFAQPAGGPAKLMATIMAKNNGGVPTGDHVRFIGIEWTAQGNIFRLISTAQGDHIIFDRNYIHVSDSDEIAHGVTMANGARVIAVINSYLGGFTCIAVEGKCTDASAIGGGNSPDPLGTFKIYNNFLESSGENIIFGGAGSNYNPTDIEIRRNHLFRPMLWKEGEPGYTPSPKGRPYIVKNNFELKSGVRVLFEANLLENCWGGFSQAGFAILLNARSQASKCPDCKVTDITMRYDRIHNVTSVFQISNAPVKAAKGGGVPADGGRFSIHDIVADQIHFHDYKGFGVFVQIGVGIGAPPLHDIQFDHITSFQPGSLALVGNRNEKPMLLNVNFTNSVFGIDGPRAPLASTGGRPFGCAELAQRSGPEEVLKACISPYKFEHNLIIAEHEKGGWPQGNIIVKSPDDAGVHDLKDGVSADPRLCSAKGPGCSKKSPGIAAASDGRNIGADVEGVEAAIAGVE